MPNNRFKLNNTDDSVTVVSGVEPVEITGNVTVSGVIGSGDTVTVEPGIDPLNITGPVTTSSATSSVKVEPGTSNINVTTSSTSSSVKVEPGTSKLNTVTSSTDSSVKVEPGSGTLNITGPVTTSSATSSVKVEPGTSPIATTLSGSPTVVTSSSASSVKVEPGTSSLNVINDSIYGLTIIGSVNDTVQNLFVTSSTDSTRHYIPTNKMPLLTLPAGHDSIVYVMYLYQNAGASFSVSNLYSAFVYPYMSVYDDGGGTSGTPVGRPLAGNNFAIESGSYQSFPGVFEQRYIVAHGLSYASVYDALSHGSTPSLLYVADSTDTNNTGYVCNDYVASAAQYATRGTTTAPVQSHFYHTLQYDSSAANSTNGYLKIQYYSFKSQY